MAECAAEMPEPFRAGDAITWFAQRYPLVKAGTVRAHIIGLTANDPSRHHYANLAARPALFTKRGNGVLVRYESCELDIDDDSIIVTDDATEPVDAVVAETQMEFALEAYLEEFILTNWARIDWGRPLIIWQSPDGRRGHQLAVPVGRLDFLAIDTATNALVVIELKRGRPTDQVVGQAARYIGWLRDEFAADGQAVEGIIVAADADERLYYAARAIPGLSVLLYEVSFALRPAALS